jgi:anti-sigma-K factor RskA
VDIQAYIQSGIIESYVLGLATAEEVEELESLKHQYAEVMQAIFEFSVLVEQKAFENSIKPPSDVKSKIMAAIKDEEKLAPVISLPADVSSNSDVPAKGFRLWQMLAAASVILFIASACLNFYLYKQYNRKNHAYEALLTERNTLQANNQMYKVHVLQWQKAAEVMSDPAMAVIKMPGTPGKEQNLATVYWNTINKDVYVRPNKLPQPAKGKQFQLWALVDGQPVDAGLLDPACAHVCKMKNIPKAQAFAITLENEGGSPTPTMNEMFVLGKV